MKKMLSILLACVLVMALAAPAFAADITTDGGTGDVIVKTTTTTEDGNSAEKFTLSIPANTEITWGTLSTELTYTVEAHLGYGKVLDVSVRGSAAAGPNKMSYSPVADVTFEMPYSLTGAVSYQSASPVVYPAADVDFNVEVAENDWKTAVVGEYADTLTFTAEIVAA